jgi:hypothetical protein
MTLLAVSVAASGIGRSEREFRQVLSERRSRVGNPATTSNPPQKACVATGRPAAIAGDDAGRGGSNEAVDDTMQC